MHRCLTVSVPLSRVWVHCPRVPEQFVTSPLCPVGYVHWDKRSDLPPGQSFKKLQVTTRQSSSAAFQVALLFADHPPGFIVSLQVEHKQFIGNGHLIGSPLR